MAYQVYTILDEMHRHRRRFDPSNVDDVKEFAFFKKFNKWRNTCPFYLEWPYQDIATMCNSKYADFMLNKITKTVKK